MKTWQKVIEGILTFVDAFVQNDPYNPRPRQQDLIYSGYRSCYPQTHDCLIIADTFWAAIEGQQSMRNQRLVDMEI